LEQENGHLKRVAWGTGRIVVRTNLTAIQDLLADGCPLTTIYQRLKDSLGGVSYRQFAEHVRGQLRSTVKHATKKQHAIGVIDSTNETASVGASLVQKWIANREKSENPGRSAKFQPGPRVPDPKDLY
jgi:hypothetical protein